MTVYIATFHDSVNNMTSLVFESNHGAGGYGVALRDDDSGLVVGCTFHGFKTIDEAIAKAKVLI